jgi:lipopolysaccharide export LptBFGC system permease protein LptF
MSIIEEIYIVARKTGAFSGANFLTPALLAVVILGLVPPKKNRYYLLMLFIVALCAGFYLLLYLYR